MTTKAAFSADEWSTITSAPVLTGMLVMAADRGGTVRETLSMSRAYATARAQEPGGLLGEVLASPPALNQTGIAADAASLSAEAPGRLRRAIDLLEHNATQDEVVEYKRFVFGLAEDVARAHREGGFLGIGGTQISEAEQHALDEVAAIFDAPVTHRGSEPRTGFSVDEARTCGDELGVDWDAAPFGVDDLRHGMEVELEHGRRDPRTNVTDDDPLLTAKIALAHLNELADYYTRLARLESSSS